MSKRKTLQSSKKVPPPKKEQSKNDDAASFGYMGAIGGGFVAYLIGEAVFAARPHPVHWVVALSGGVLVGVTSYGVTLWQQAHRRK